jgi:methionyl aminopeptidase
VTTEEIDRIVHEATIKRGAYPSPLNYHGFPRSVCTSINEVVCHGIPENRTLREGDILNIDVSCYIGGFHGDNSEMFCVGEVDDAAKKLIQVAVSSTCARETGARTHRRKDNQIKECHPHLRI